MRKLVCDPPAASCQATGRLGVIGAPLSGALFDRTSSPVPVDGWTIQYASASGTGLFLSSVTPPARKITPAHNKLVRASPAGAGVVAGTALIALVTRSLHDRYPHEPGPASRPVVVVAARGRSLGRRG